MTSSARFDVVEQTLEMFIENCRHLGVVASDFGGASSSSGTQTQGLAASSSGVPSAQTIFNQKLQTFVSGLAELDQLKNQYQDVKVPLELLNYVDSGKNPQLYTKDVMESCLQKNKQVNGKIELYTKFRAYLIKELVGEMPKELKQYWSIRECHSHNLQQSNNSATNLKDDADKIL